MKRLAKSLLLLVLVSALAATRLYAQNIIAIDEFGNSTTNGTPGLLSTTGPDPTGGLPATIPVLSYALPFVGDQGDLLIFNPFGPGDPLDDVIRFTGTGDVIFYADNVDGPIPGDKAIVPGPPNPLYHNQAAAQIPGAYIVDYTPTAGQPGYDASDPTYQIYIDHPIAAVPEPGISALLLASFGVMAAKVKKWPGKKDARREESK